MINAILTNAQDLSIISIIVHIVFALLTGLIISTSYALSCKGKTYSSNLCVTLVILPTVVSVVIILIGSNLARAVSLGGVFALVRFRSVPGDSKDIAYVFFSMVTGLACGIDAFAVAFVFSFCISFLFVFLTFLGYANSQKQQKVLKITIPESLDFAGVFDDIFEKYFSKWNLQKVKTTNMGTLFEVSYEVLPKVAINEKALIDKLRTRNGNLNISLGRYSSPEFPPL